MLPKFKKWDLLPLLLSALYFVLIHFAMGLRPEHLMLSGLILTCYFLHSTSRQWIFDFLPAALFGILYDFLRIIPKSWAGPIHVGWPHHLEALLFGFSYQGQKIIPNDFFLNHHTPFLDILTGIAYSLHIVVPMSFGFFAWLKNRIVARQFIWAFFVVNFLAFLTYIALPVAPPWYVQQYGFGPGNWSIPSSAAGLIHFDHLTGTSYFQNIYAKNAWVFGAIPSMHAGFPLLVVLFARKVFRKALMPFILYMILIWFSAVYLRHHYIIDLAAGALYVLATNGILSLANRFRRRSSFPVEFIPKHATRAHERSGL